MMCVCVSAARRLNGSRAQPRNTLYLTPEPIMEQAIVDAEWQIIYEKLEKCVQSGASIILSKVRWW